MQYHGGFLKGDVVQKLQAVKNSTISNTRAMYLAETEISDQMIQ
jgi:hypothetical protein